MGPSFSRDSFPLTPALLSFPLAPKSLFTLSAILRAVLAVAGRMAKRSSLPPSIRPFLYDRPQEQQGLSPTASSPGEQEEVEIPAPAAFPLPRSTAFPLPPIAIATHPTAFPDLRRQYSGYESGAREPVSPHAATALATPERLGGPSSIPHGSARRYRSPIPSDPNYPPPIRQGPSQYAGSHSLPGLSQVTGAAGQWREGEAGPSSLVHAHPYGGGGMHRQSPTYPAPQPIYRRATEGSYSMEGPPHTQPGSYERLREQHEGYPPRPTSELSYGEPSRSRISLPPMYSRQPEYGTRASEPIELPPLGHYGHAIQSTSSMSSDHTRADEGENPLKRTSEFGDEGRPTNIPRKILVACDFCRGRKLRCDGNRPTCSNCLTRQVSCSYRLQPKRRGPGKAAKGSRKKRVSSKGGGHSETSSQAARDDDGFDMQTIAPELRSRASMPTLGGGRYDSRQASPEWTTQQRRRARSRNRTPSSEYYSTPSESGSKR